MAKKLYEEDYIYDIACAIREKCGDEDVTFKTCDMADAIRALTISDGSSSGTTTEGGIPTPLVLEGSMYNMFTSPAWNSFIENYGDQLEINTTRINSAFYNNPFLVDASNLTITVSPNESTGVVDTEMMFCLAYKIQELPTIEGDWVADSFYRLFDSCYWLQNVSAKFFKNVDWSYIEANSDEHTYQSAFGSMLLKCYALRSFPVSIFGHDYPLCTSFFYWNNLSGCYAKDEWINLPIPYTSALSGQTISASNCTRLSEFTFATEEDEEGNVVPLEVNWSNMTLDLSTYVGYGTSTTKETLYKYGQDFNDDNEVTSALTYAELKANPDWHTIDVYFSRYNHDSAVNTINSLPDTTSSTTGGNVVKFKSTSGLSTDGGAISNLTGEEIAVAAAKGWTVTLVD